ncbi:trypsin-like peptidase domain-containing protein [Pseudomonas abyssi]|uniref:trypsin-like peptidase domain-containing protein n=1 Tax=Pseudomonas abyssi TaxID=170540 RepID=UPI0026CE3C91
MSPSKKIILAALVFSVLPACTTQRFSSADIYSGREALDRQLKIEVTNKNQTSRGSAAWIQPGFVLTASHLFLGASENSIIRVSKNGMTWENAEIFAINDPAYTDLAIIKVDQNSLANLAPPNSPVKLCSFPIQPGQEVLVASGLSGVVSSSFGSPEMVRNSRGQSWSRHLTGYYAPGTSGAATYDAKSGCLGGVVSKRRKSTNNHDLEIYSTEIVTLPQIIEFLDSVRESSTNDTPF